MSLEAQSDAKSPVVMVGGYPRVVGVNMPSGAVDTRVAQIIPNETPTTGPATNCYDGRGGQLGRARATSQPTS